MPGTSLGPAAALELLLQSTVIQDTPCVVGGGGAAGYFSCADGENVVTVTAQDEYGALPQQWPLPVDDVGLAIVNATGEGVGTVTSMEVVDAGCVRFAYTVPAGLGDLFVSLALAATVRGLEVRCSKRRVAPWLPLGEALSGSVILAGVPVVRVDEETRAAFVAELTGVWLGGRERLGALLYHGQHDGMTAAEFHRCCDGRGATLTLIRSKKGYVFGAYTDSNWESPSIGKCTRCDDAFLFSVVGPFGEGWRE